MNRVLPLSIVQRALRAKLCAGCPDRTPGDESIDRPRGCESNCQPFRHLPRLWAIAVHTDPMVGRTGPALLRAVREVDPPGASAAPGRTWRDRAFATALKDLSGK
jgi:hypothetical protein